MTIIYCQPSHKHLYDKSEQYCSEGTSRSESDLPTTYRRSDVMDEFSSEPVTSTSDAAAGVSLTEQYFTDSDPNVKIVTADDSKTMLRNEEPTTCLDSDFCKSSGFEESKLSIYKDDYSTVLKKTTNITATQIKEKKLLFVTTFLIVVLILCSIDRGLFLKDEKDLQCYVTDDIIHFPKRKTRRRNDVINEYLTGIKLVLEDDTVSDKCLKNKEHFKTLLQSLMGTLKPYNTNIVVAPVGGRSLDAFFHSFQNGVSLEESMNFEWIRLCSFQNFRCSSNISPITLSRCGFFYTGTGSEVRCYSCGVTYSQWQPNDNVFNIHRRISQHCEHLNETDQRNVSVRHRSVIGLNREGMANPSSTNVAPTVLPSQTSLLSNFTPIASSNQQDGVSNHLTTDAAAGIAEMTSAPTNRSLPDTQNNSRQETSSQQNRFSTPVNHPTRRSHYVSSVDSPGVSSSTINKLSPLGVNFDKPRYPQYAVLTVRISTFNGWPAKQSPRKMAEAGFIYAGYADYSRCFFCGGGLRNWEEDDDPWIEHARWFPRCAFVKQNKGGQFIQLVHERLQEMLNDTTAMETSTPSNESRDPTIQEIGTDDSASANQSVHHDNIASIESMPSYQSVLELGYPPDMIKNIIHQLTILGQTAISSGDILEAIFQIEEGGTFEESVRLNNKMESEDDNVMETFQIVQENRRLKEQRLCMICLEKDSCVTFLPCSHLVCCEDCSPAMRKCPKCHQIVQGSIKTWLV